VFCGFFEKLIKREDYRKSPSILRDKRLRETDVMLVSYPRSGNTWMRVIIAHILYPQMQINSLQDIKALVPDIYTSFRKGAEYSSPRVVKTHQSYATRHEPLNPNFYSKNIYIVRHPFDVIASYYDFQSNLWKDKPYSEPSLGRFVEKVVSGAFTVSWQEHVLSWHCMREEKEILFVRYEDLLEQPAEVVKLVAEFLGRSLSPEEIEGVCERSSIEAMRELDRRGSVVKRDYAFVRNEDEKRAAKSELTSEMKDLIAARSAIAMDLFGYER
jgi:hypothetical protein